MSTEDADELMNLIACFSERCTNGTGLHQQASATISGVLDDLTQELQQHSEVARLDGTDAALTDAGRAATRPGPAPSAPAPSGGTEWLFVEV